MTELQSFLLCLNKALGIQSSVLMPVKGCAHSKYHILDTSWLALLLNAVISFFCVILSLSTSSCLKQFCIFLGYNFCFWKVLNQNIPEIQGDMYSPDSQETLPLSPKTRHFRSRLDTGESRRYLIRSQGAQCGSWVSRGLPDRRGLGCNGQSGHREHIEWQLVVSTEDEESVKGARTDQQENGMKPVKLLC